MADKVVQQQQDRMKKKHLEQHTLKMEVCDGTTSQHLRKWIDAATEAQARTGANDAINIEMLGYMSSGLLRISVRRFIEGETAVGSATVRTHISANSLMRVSTNSARMRWRR